MIGKVFIRGKIIIVILLVMIISNDSKAQKNHSPSLRIIDSGFIFSEAPFKSCHASTLVELPGHKIIVAWFGGDNEGDPGVSIWYSQNDGKRWSEPKEIANGKQENGMRYACWNPVLFYNNSSLFLFYKVGASPRSWWGEMKISKDSGRTWSAARKLPDGFLGPIKNKPLQLSNGNILCPSSVESEDGKWTIHLEICDRNGEHWKKNFVDCDSFNAIQPTLLTYKNGGLQLLCRTKNNVIAQSWSHDGGYSWAKMRTTKLSNPNSGIDAVTLMNGQQVLVYNPLPIGKEWWQGRSSLEIAVSTNGKEWTNKIILEDHLQGEYSYPAIIQTSDGDILLTYTYERKKIKYVRIK